MSKYPYRELVGNLLYAAVISRPDISVAVNFLGQRVADPRQSDNYRGHGFLLRRQIPGLKHFKKKAIQGSYDRARPINSNFSERKKEMRLSKSERNRWFPLTRVVR